MPEIDDRAIGVEHRPSGGEPEVELDVIRRLGRDVEFVHDDGSSHVYDLAELRHMLEEDMAA